MKGSFTVYFKLFVFLSACYGIPSECRADKLTNMMGASDKNFLNSVIKIVVKFYLQKLLETG